MCSVSAIYDSFTDRWKQTYVQPYTSPWVTTPTPHPAPSQEEIDEFRALLAKARQWDIEHNQPDCETEEKRRKLKDLADELGVDISFV